MITPAESESSMALRTVILVFHASLSLSEVKRDRQQKGYVRYCRCFVRRDGVQSQMGRRRGRYWCDDEVVFGEQVDLVNGKSKLKINAAIDIGKSEAECAPAATFVGQILRAIEVHKHVHYSVREILTLVIACIS